MKTKERTPDDIVKYTLEYYLRRNKQIMGLTENIEICNEKIEELNHQLEDWKTILSLTEIERQKLIND